MNLRLFVDEKRQNKANHLCFKINTVIIGERQQSYPVLCFMLLLQHNSRAPSRHKEGLIRFFSVPVLPKEKRTKLLWNSLSIDDSKAKCIKDKELYCYSIQTQEYIVNIVDLCALRSCMHQLSMVMNCQIHFLLWIIIIVGFCTSQVCQVN